MRITASCVGGIAKMRKTTKRSKKVEELLYSTFRATIYGQVIICDRIRGNQAFVVEFDFEIRAKNTADG